jgi:tripartite-type tricarboxylate transporter receptor subunit TctC
MIVPYPAGGASDLTARAVAKELERELKAPVVVENIGGASGGIAAMRLQNAPADGRTFFQGSQNELILPPLIIKGTKHQPSDFEIVHPITTTSLVLVVRKGLPVNTLQEFVALSRSKSTDEPLTYGSPGNGSLYHLISDSMGKLAGVQYTHVPYKGSAPLMQDLMGDRIDFTIMAFSNSMLPMIQDGRYRIIANITKDKPKELARFPHVSELAIFKNVDYASISSYYVKKGTPQGVRQYLNTAIGNAVASPGLIKALEDDGRQVPQRMTLRESEKFYQQENEKYDRIVKLTGLPKQDQ